MRRSKIKSAKRNPNDFKIDDLFGTSSYSKDATKYPTTVPIIKATTRNNSILSDLFDKNSDQKHFSAGVPLQRRRQPSQQVFVSNNKWVCQFSSLLSFDILILFTEIFSREIIKVNLSSTTFRWSFFHGKRRKNPNKMTNRLGSFRKVSDELNVHCYPIWESKFQETIPLTNWQTPGLTGQQNIFLSERQT